jgi:hypothetical protein
MELDDLLIRYFGCTDTADIPPQALSAGLEHMRVDLGLAKDRGQRFALWTMMYMLGSAPDLDVAFKDPADRDAARNFMDFAARADEP